MLVMEHGPADLAGHSYILLLITSTTSTSTSELGGDETGMTQQGL